MWKDDPGECGRIENAGRLPCSCGRFGTRSRALSRHSDSAVISLAETTDPSPDQPEERRRVFGVVEKVGEVECQKGEIIRCVHAWVYLPQKPFVVPDQSLPDRRVRCKLVSPIIWAHLYDRRLSCTVDLEALIQFPLQVW